jgi:hypothetical protein
MFVSMLRHPKAAAAAAAVQTLLVLLAGAEPRPINEPEREAVAIVAAFLSRGPAALEERLAPDAPLRALPREDVLAELGVRTGPRDGARWTLQTAGGEPGDVAFRVTFPSGDEDGLFFRMKKTGDRWSLHEVLTIAETPAPPARPTPPAPPARFPPRTILLMAAFVLGALAAVSFARSRVLAVIALVSAAVVATAAIFIPRFTHSPEPRAHAFAELRSLLPLREALARGDDASVPKGVSPAARDTGMLWMLQSGATLTVPGNANDALAGLTTVARTPLAEVVRARLALTSGHAEVAAAAFRRALAIQPRRDDILVEAATSFGVQPAAAAFLDDRRFDQSRDPRLHYARALRAAASDQAAAYRHLRTAWTLKPFTREELVREPRLLPLLRDVRTMSMISYYGVEEPSQRSPSLAKTPIPLPRDAQALVCGNFLRIQIAGAAIDVPGGAALAPPDARVVPATYWKRLDDQAALRDAKTLLAQPARSRSGGGPLRLVRAAQALADHNRWSELIALTDDITPQDPIVAPALITLRIQALLRADRDADARALANGAAIEELASRGTFPGTLLAIGDAIASGGSRGSAQSSWDLSERLYRTIKSPEQQTIVAARLRQLELRRALATNGVTVATQHFDVRHDPSMNPAIAGRIGELLEAELARLRQTFIAPAESHTEPRRVTVNVFYWDAFREGITGGDHILGVYDGEILFPFGVVNQFKPEIVAIITHELTHAVVAQATADNAPRWFQEGLAQRMELLPQHDNAFHETASGLVLPVPLLDAVLENAADADTMEQGYRVAQTFIRFLESRYGDHAVRTLIASFAAGKNTEDAIAALTGKSLDAVNRDFREWGFAHSATFVNTEPWPYRDLYSPAVDPRIKAGFQWSRRP